MTQTLYEKLQGAYDIGALNKSIPDEITKNLSSRIKLRPYQEIALQFFLYYTEDFNERPSNPHLLFHMATGSGKTVLMAALILDLYRRDYRNFLFFVNSTQIIEKTKDNFLNHSSGKHLFKPIIRIDGKPVEIQAVETFDAVSSDTINIHFTTIQGLHRRMHAPKENAVTIEDFRDYKVVMISDEAHHLNAQTKNKLTQIEAREIGSWEVTVTEIFHQHPKNILLEFTATADLNHPAIKDKYHNKILFDYQLKHFREDGYSKDIELRQADLPSLERMMQAMVFSQYRRKVAEVHGIHCKPVILMKSRTIAESAANESLFTSMVKGLSGKAIQEIRESSLSDETLSRAFRYIIDGRGVEVDEFALELQGDFGDGKVANVNKPNDLEKLQIDLNNLEDLSNDIRVVFAVNKLDEGWDVLNLFDIVRLYNTRDSRGDKIGNTTMSEAQLIGRGARYFPFTAPDQPEATPEKRKYDGDVEHPLRVLEELYYHCSHNPRYIDEIKRALKKIGMGDENSRTVHLRLKKSFKESLFYQIGYVWVNERVENSREGVDSLNSYGIRDQFRYPTPLRTRRVSETSAFGSETTEKKPDLNEPILRCFPLAKFNRSILDFAMDGNEFFHFVNLRKHFPHLTSMAEFRTSDSYLGGVTVEVRGLPEHLKKMSFNQKLEVTRYVLSQIEFDIKCESVEFVGTRDFTRRKIRECFTDKTLKLRIEGEAGRSWADSRISGSDLIDLNGKDWHAYDDNFGTDQEKRFILFLNYQAESLRERYEDFYLLRNEKAVKLFSFKNGKGFEPDFILFLRKKDTEIGSILQIFIEPKGKHLTPRDEWKETFLEEIQWRDRAKTLFQGEEYHVYGLPFFHEEGENYFKFKEAFSAATGLRMIS